MHPVSHLVREFFEGYERSRNAMDASLIDEQYPDAFMFADPAGARIAQKQVMMSGLTNGHQWLKSLGHKSTTLVSLNELMLDEYYTLARAQFMWRFEKSSGPPIDVEIDSTFILFIKDGTARIVFQHEHEDFQQAPRGRGLMP